MFTAFPLVLSPLDPQFLSRVDPSTMSEQTLMELLVSDMEETNAFKNTDGEFTDIESWDSLKFDDSGNISHIKFLAVWCTLFDSDDEVVSMKDGGSIDFQWLPPDIKDVNVCGLDLEGTLKTALLPTEIFTLCISDNKLKGTFSIENLPSSLTEVDIGNNSFEGTLQLGLLPACMRDFYAWDNAFTGTVDLLHLPKTLIHLRLCGNRLTGTIDLSVIPPGMRMMTLNDNNFQQDVLVIGDLPAGLVLRVGISRFNRVVDLQGNPLQNPKIY